MTDPISHTLVPAAAGSAVAAVAKTEQDDGFGTFLETLLDIVNPLQHLPVISTIYRSITGDEIAAPARIIGGTLFGGPIGAAGALINVAVEDATGSDIGKHAVALLTGEETQPGEQLASLDGRPPQGERGELVFVASGDANAMTPDYVYWNGKRHRPETAAPQQSAALPAQARTPAAQPDVEAAAISAVAMSAAPQSAATLPTATPPIAKPSMASLQETKSSATSSAAIKPNDATAVAPPALPAQSAWVGAALAEAEADRTATQAGRGAAPQAPPAWLAAAMGQALDKYQAMAIARNAAATHGEFDKAVEPDN